MSLLTDGRFSGATRGDMIGHINVDVEPGVWDVRKANWEAPEKPVTGYLKKYRASVTSASKGAICR